MFFSLLLGAAAGFATPYAEPHIEKLLKNVLLDDVPMKEGEFRIFAFILMLMLAAVIIALGGANSSAFLLTLGGGLGIFGTRLIAAGKSKVNKAKTKPEPEPAAEAADE